jgi:putative ABC transport system permease protein
MDPEQPMAAVATMEQLLGDSLARSRFTMMLLAIFAALALTLASVGIYGVIAYGVTQRTQEFGIRIALGADGRDVLRLVLGQGTRLVLLGIGLGVVLALTLGRFLSTLLYGISPTDPLTFGAVALLLVLVALAACYVPARRATRVDLIETLRYE